MTVHVKTQKEWDIISEYYSIPWGGERLFSSCRGETCIRVNPDNTGQFGYADKDFYLSRNMFSNGVVISFEEWSKDKKTILQPFKVLKRHKV